MEVAVAGSGVMQDSLLYMCCFYWLMNKKDAWAYDRTEERQAGKTKLNAGKEKAESERYHVAPLETDALKPCW